MNLSTNHPQIILASSSAIRRTLLENAGVGILVRKPLSNEAIEKAAFEHDDAEQLAVSLAKVKALSIVEPAMIIIGADQTLSCGNMIFHKPATHERAQQQLIELRGKTHRLHSGVACAQNGKIIWSHLDTATLTMRDFSDPFLQTYMDIRGTDILNCVGCYQLENRGVQLFDKIDGDYFTILGLPLLPLLAFLRKTGAIAA